MGAAWIFKGKGKRRRVVRVRPEDAFWKLSPEEKFIKECDKFQRVR